MDLYGYPKDEFEGEQLLHLREVSLVVTSADELAQLIRFLQKAEQKLRDNGDGFGHMHLCDNEPGLGKAHFCDVIVARVDGRARK